MSEPLTMEQLQSEHPDLFAQVQAKAKTDMQDDLDAKAKAESERVESIMGILPALGELSDAGKNAAIAVQSIALADPSVSIEMCRADMAVAALTAKAEEVDTAHGDAVAAMASEQGDLSSGKNLIMGDGKVKTSYASALEKVLKSNPNFGKVV